MSALWIHGGRVAKHMAVTLEVMGSRPSLGDICEIHFLELIRLTVATMAS